LLDMLYAKLLHMLYAKLLHMLYAKCVLPRIVPPDN
jgi:hypothetical protein